MSGASVRTLLERHGLAAHRDRGQNFLIDPALAERLVALAEVGSEETVIEVGAGLGMLTRALARRARRVIAVEVDAGLVRALRSEGLPGNVELLHADARGLDFVAEARARGVARVVANLPYSVATPLLRRLLDARGILAGWSVMVQREVAQRLVAKPGERAYGSLAVLHALCVRVERVLDLRPGCFYPPPAVASSFVRCRPREDSPLAPGELEALEPLLRGAFRQRRKTLSNALRGAGFDPEALGRTLATAGVSGSLRPQALSPDSWLALARAWRKQGSMVPSRTTEEEEDA